MRKLAVGGLIVLASACGSNETAVVQPPVPETASTLPELTTTSTEAVTTTEPAPTTTEAPATSTTVLLREQATTTAVRRASPAQSSASGDCGGSLPPCSVMMRESRGSLTVYNYEGSGASGKWQIMPGTWDGYGGYANAADAPESVQDAKARQLWAGGAGCWHWNAC